MAASVGSPPSATMRAEPAVSASGTGTRPSLRKVLRHWPSAWVCESAFFTVASEALRQRHELVAHAQEMLADDMQPGPRQQVVDVGHASCHGVLDRDHGVAGVAGLHRRQGVLERGAGDRLERRECFLAGEVRVGAWLALK